MSYVICQLCRKKIVIAPNTDELRCPGCGAKVPQAKLAEAIKAADQTLENKQAETSEKLACKSCLGLFSPLNIGALSTCPNCGNKVDKDKAATLAKSLEGLENKLNKELLEGSVPQDLIVSYFPQDINREAAWKYLDRLISELPFNRAKVESENNHFAKATSCDSCGLASGDIEVYEALWEIQPQELKRYKEGYGGFEGDFIRPKNYQRPAIYCVCKKCSKAAKSSNFANGYPYNIGYRLASFKLKKK